MITKEAIFNHSSLHSFIAWGFHSCTVLLRSHYSISIGLRSGQSPSRMNSVVLLFWCCASGHCPIVWQLGPSCSCGTDGLTFVSNKVCFSMGTSQWLQGTQLQAYFLSPSSPCTCSEKGVSVKILFGFRPKSCWTLKTSPCLSPLSIVIVPDILCFVQMHLSKSQSCFHRQVFPFQQCVTHTWRLQMRKIPCFYRCLLMIISPIKPGLISSTLMQSVYLFFFFSIL